MLLKLVSIPLLIWGLIVTASALLAPGVLWTSTPSIGVSGSMSVAQPRAVATGVVAFPLAEPQPVVKPQDTVIAAALPAPLPDPVPTLMIVSPGTAYVFGLGTVMLADVGTMVLPTGEEVGLKDHAEIRHTKEEADEVRAFLANYMLLHPIFAKQPSCDDGFHRFFAEISPGVWAVWVMKQIGDNLFDERTAFKSYSQGYVNGIRDDCGEKNSKYWGHEYAK